MTGFPLPYVSFQKPEGNHIIFIALCQPGITVVLTDISSVLLISSSKCFIIKLNSFLSAILAFSPIMYLCHMILFLFLVVYLTRQVQ